MRVKGLQKSPSECLRMQSCRHKHVGKPRHNNGHSAVPPLLHPASDPLKMHTSGFKNTSRSLLFCCEGLFRHTIGSGPQIWLRAGKTNQILFDHIEGRGPALANELHKRKAPETMKRMGCLAPLYTTGLQPFCFRNNINCRNTNQIRPMCVFTHNYIRVYMHYASMYVISSYRKALQLDAHNVMLISMS